MNRLSACTVFAVCGLFVSACGSSSTNSSGADQPSSLANQTPKNQSNNPNEGTVVIDPSIAAACGISAPKFGFDSTRIEGAAASTLDLLAQCFVSGPMKGKGMKLVGHADPRGEEEYNFGLGQRRAGSVALYLEKRGLESNRVATSSRGELEAAGTDESGWAADRRVEILAN